jgi:hypothetical protein
VLQLAEQGGVQRFETAALGRPEVIRQDEGGDVRECAMQAAQLDLELGGPRRERRSLRGRRAHDTEGRAQELAATGRVRDAEGADQANRLRGGEPVAVACVEERVLLVAGERGEAVGQRGTDGAAGESSRGPGRQPPTEREAAVDPVGFVAEPARHLTRSQLVVIDERAHDAGLVERGAGARRRVGDQQQALVVGHGPRRFDDHRDEAVALLSPAREALEAVEHLERRAAVVVRCGRRDPQRKLDPHAGLRPQRSRAQPGPGRAQGLERDEAHAAGARCGRRGKRGGRSGAHHILALSRRQRRAPGAAATRRGR